LEARYERFAAFCRAGGYDDVRGWGCGGIELDAIARGVLDDAAGYGWAGSCAEDGVGVRDGAGGAGVFDDAVSEAWCEEHRQECLCYWDWPRGEKPQA